MDSFDGAATAAPAAAAGKPRPSAAAAERQRDAVEELYQARLQKENAAAATEGDRSLVRIIAKKHGVKEQQLRDATDELPAGLRNTEDCYTLRRHVHAVLKIPSGKGVTLYRTAELQAAVIRSFDCGPKKARTEMVFGEPVELGLGRSAGVPEKLPRRPGQARCGGAAKGGLQAQA